MILISPRVFRFHQESFALGEKIFTKILIKIGGPGYIYHVSLIGTEKEECFLVFPMGVKDRLLSPFRTAQFGVTQNIYQATQGCHIGSIFFKNVPESVQEQQ